MAGHMQNTLRPSSEIETDDVSMDEILTMGNDSDFDNDIEVVDNPRLKSSLVETRTLARVWEGQNSRSHHEWWWDRYIISALLYIAYVG